ncbi:hypothetical protein GGS20DRAFT_563961 [Poronia punctata]|nr:hypothetical protein GGS20DRAFT_563961 [Poronia punctata]
MDKSFPRIRLFSFTTTTLVGVLFSFPVWRLRAQPRVTGPFRSSSRFRQITGSSDRRIAASTRRRGPIRNY